nr:hypothetical protein [Paenibacillus elgii]
MTPQAQPSSRPDGKKTADLPTAAFGFGRRGEPVPKVRAKNTRAAIRRLWGYLKRQRAALAGVIALVLLGLALSLAGPYLIGTAIDRYIALREPNGLLQLCVLLLASTSAAALFRGCRRTSCPASPDERCGSCGATCLPICRSFRCAFSTKRRTGS